MSTFAKRNLIAVAGAGVIALAAAGTALAAGPLAGTRACDGTGTAARAGSSIQAGVVVQAAAASYLGISTTDLATTRRAGTSLAQLATQKGKTVDGLTKAMTAAFTANADKLVAAGTLTAAQAKLLVDHFTAQLPTMIARTATGPAGMGAGMGAGMHTGMGAGMHAGMGRTASTTAAAGLQRRVGRS